MSALTGIPETAWRCRHCGAWNTPTEERFHGPRACALCEWAQDEAYMGDGVTLRRVQLRNGDYALCLDGHMVHLSEDVCTALWNTLKGVAGVRLESLEPLATTMSPSYAVLNCREIRRT